MIENPNPEPTSAPQPAPPEQVRAYLDSLPNGLRYLAERQFALDPGSMMRAFVREGHRP